MKKAALHSLGCKVNSYETQAMSRMLTEAGYEIVPFGQKADLYIINTCSVTNAADKKSRQMLHRAKALNPEAVVIAAGCYAQTSADKAGLDPSVDIIIGNNKKQELLSLIEEFESKRKERSKALPENGAVQSDRKEEGTAKAKENERALKEAAAQEDGVLKSVIDINDPSQPYEELEGGEPAEHTRAFLKIEDGCDNFCSYCMIPYARGRARSRDEEKIVKEAGILAEKGYKEVVLTGINISFYGKDTGTGLLELIRRISDIPGIERIRLGSIEPNIITEDFVREISAIRAVCPHFHLSLQSGCDSVLKRMNRKYTAAGYLEKCDILRRYYEHPAITTDIIVGFPGESDEEFLKTLKFVDAVRFYEVHVFKYSRRARTAADKMAGQVSAQVKNERSAELIKLAARLKEEFISWYDGKEVEVLFEEAKTTESGVYYTGFTPEYVKMWYRSAENLQNRIMNVEFSSQLV